MERGMHVVVAMAPEGRTASEVKTQDCAYGDMANADLYVVVDQGGGASVLKVRECREEDVSAEFVQIGTG